MKKVAVVFNGGTISMKVDPRIEAAVPTLKGEEIMAMVTGIEKFAEIKSYNFSNLPGPHVTPKKMIELSKYIKDILKDEEISGVVITHGTDTLEETAFLLDLTIDTKKPIILTGSMRNSSELGYDGPANLSASICTAINEEAGIRGVLVCMNDELHLASEVTKVHSMHLDAFKSLEFGPVGVVDTNRVFFYKKPFKREKVLTEKIEEKVALIKTVAGDNSEVINFLIEKNYKGIVIECMGRGNIPPDMVAGIERAIKNNIPVVIVSRCYEGRVLDSYGYHGGGKELRNLGVILGDNLPGQKARIKLMLALGTTSDLKEIKKIFEGDSYI